MAVTFHDTPGLYTPSDNPVNWTFSSDKTAEANFIFIVAVYINNVLIKNEMVAPDSGDIYGRYDASAWASNACNSPSISQTLIDDAVNYAYVRITVRERYGDPVADEAETIGTNITVFKARLHDDDFVDWDYTDYMIDGVSDKSWLTNFPSTNNPKVRETNEQIRIMAINNSATITAFKVSLYDSDGVLIVADQLNQVTPSERILIFNISPSVITASALAISVINFTTTSYYTVEVNLGAGLSVYRIDVDRPCVYPRYQRLHFLSQLGTIESLSFDLVSHLEGKIKSFGYEKQFGEWNGSSFEFNKTQGRTIDYVKFLEETLVIESDWLNEYIQHWLVRNCYGSALVYVEDLSNGSLIRRKIMQTSYADKWKDNNLLFMEKVVLTLPSMTSANL